MTTPKIATGTKVVQARNVSKIFKRDAFEVTALDNVSIDIAQGEFLALMGPSGSGKTTLLNLIAGLDKPSGGDVWVGPEKISVMSESQLAKWRTRHVGFVFQFYHLLPELDALENVVLPAMIGNALRGRVTFREIRARATETLVRFGMGERLTHRPSQLSGGEQQRVAIARAMILDPAVVIADEPTGNLDSATGEKVLDLLIREQKERGLALLLVTHDERVAKRCGRMLVMQDGRIRGESTSP
jgi:putative ABC transport system ATP-binding protein